MRFLRRLRDMFRFEQGLDNLGDREALVPPAPDILPADILDVADDTPPSRAR